MSNVEGKVLSVQLHCLQYNRKIFLPYQFKNSFAVIFPLVESLCWNVISLMTMAINIDKKIATF